MKQFISILIMFLGGMLAGKAQLNFIFLPELYGRNVDGLGSFQVQNLGNEKMVGQVLISVRENSISTPVLVVTTPLVSLNTGLTNFPKTYFSNSAFNFGMNAYGAIANQTRTLPPGEYNFCFRFVPQD